jgi:hypothetical protein
MSELQCLQWLAMARLHDPFLKRLFIMAIVIIAFAEFAIHKMAQMTPHMYLGAKVPPQITTARANHILYGDAHGGGHLHGTGKPCKSEFPADWDAAKILQVVTKDAANDNLDWKLERNGYEVADVNENGVKIRLVVNAKHTEIITAYPVNTPRNACPAANDNGD